MKAMVTILAMLGGAGGFGLFSTAPSAPLLIATATLPDPHLPQITDLLKTYAAPAPMDASDVSAWARSFARPYPGERIILIYPPGQPVPDPSKAETLRDALWIAEAAPSHWRVDISTRGRATLSRFDPESGTWKVINH